MKELGIDVFNIIQRMNLDSPLPIILSGDGPFE